MRVYQSIRRHSTPMLEAYVLLGVPHEFSLRWAKVARSRGRVKTETTLPFSCRFCMISEVISVSKCHHGADARHPLVLHSPKPIHQLPHLANLRDKIGSVGAGLSLEFVHQRLRVGLDLDAPIPL